jgi:deoxyadenosine/deoxycytidine kinase
MNHNAIYIDGMVGAGKTTLLKILEEEGFSVVPEPYLENPLLDKFYNDKKRYAFASQVFFLNKKFELIKENSKVDKCIIDRSIYGDFIFAQMLFDNKNMLQEEFDIYTELFDNILTTLPKPKLIINLDISLEETLKRIKKRGRDYEQTVEVDYWIKLHKYFKNFIENCPFPILNIDVNDKDIENNKNDKQEVLNLISTSLKIINCK